MRYIVGLGVIAIVAAVLFLSASCGSTNIDDWEDGTLKDSVEEIVETGEQAVETAEDGAGEIWETIIGWI